MRPCYCLQDFPWGGLSVCSPVPIARLSTRPPGSPTPPCQPDAPLECWRCGSAGLAARLRTAGSVCSGSGPWTQKHSERWVTSLSRNDLGTHVQFNQNNRLKVIIMSPVSSLVLPRELNSMWDVGMDPKGIGCWALNTKTHPKPNLFQEVCAFSLSSRCSPSKIKAATERQFLDSFGTSFMCLRLFFYAWLQNTC